ncbi:hypothetical protein FQN57_006213 [Myotisia sp. PD_48]|nr:hypothetical protein FQN57_006213 [Myotisia sp. PD_48]
MKASLVLLGLVAQALAVAVPNEDAGVPSNVKVRDTTHGGTGCPSDSNSVRATVSKDKKTITFLYSKLFATIGPDTPVSENRKNCQVNIDLEGEAGYQYAVTGASYYGFARLDEGVTGTQRTNYYVSGETDQSSTSTSNDGPFKGEYFLKDNISKKTWSPCKGGSNRFNINSEVRLTADRDSCRGEMSGEDVNGSVRHVVNLEWRKC